MAMHRPAQMVLIEVEDSSPLRFSDFDHFGQINELVRARRDYQEVRAERLAHLGCRISLWQPKDQTATAPKPAAAANGLRR
jgi:hypothetical protein